MRYRIEGTAIDSKGVRQDFAVISIPDAPEELCGMELNVRVKSAVRRMLGPMKEVLITEMSPTEDLELVILQGGLYSESWKRPGRSGVDHAPVSG